MDWITAFMVWFLLLLMKDNIQHSQCLFSQSLSLSIIAQSLSQRQTLKLFFHDTSNMDPVEIFSKTSVQFYLDWIVVKISVTDVRFFLTAKWKLFIWPTSTTFMKWPQKDWKTRMCLSPIFIWNKYSYGESGFTWISFMHG